MGGRRRGESRAHPRTAVVGRREDGDQLTLCKELIAVLHHLVCSADEVHVVLVQKFLHHLRAKREGDTSVVLAPPLDTQTKVGAA
jgi:hypothetical protein